MTRDLSSDPYIRMLRDALVAEHEATIAEEQRLADEAGETGNVERQRWHLERVARLRAIPYPWEQSQAAA